MKHELEYLKLDEMNPNLSVLKKVLLKTVSGLDMILESRKCFNKIFQKLISLYKEMLSPIKLILWKCLHIEVTYLEIVEPATNSMPLFEVQINSK